MATSSELPQKHVPAWKRLGLKLKYASDVPEPAANAPKTLSTSENPVQTEIKRPAQDLDQESRPSKKRKSSPTQEFDVNGDAAVATTETNNTTSGNQALQTPDKSYAISRDRRKSVTFTPDTKIEDGFTGQAYFKDWANGQKKDQPTSEPAQEQTPAEKKLSKKEKKQAKQEAKAAKPKKQPATPNGESSGGSHSREVPDYVLYLTQFHSDPGNWKFNKRKQNDLLKNALNIWRIPAQHNDALVAYVGGLQGAYAQQRLLDQAEDVLKELLERDGTLDEIERMESRESRNAAYQRAIQRQEERLEKHGYTEHDVQNLEEIKNRTERENRAEALLLELLPKELVPPPPKPAPKPASASVPAPAPVARPPPMDVPVPLGPDGQPLPLYMASGTPMHTRFDEDDDLPSLKAKAPAPKKRSRKARTDVSSSSSSDESGSDDSSSDEESSASAAKPKRAKIFDKKLLDAAFSKKSALVKKAKSETSESESSSESSEDDSSDDDE